MMQQLIRECLQNDADALRQELKKSQAENARLLQRNSTEVDIADGLRREKIRLEQLNKQWYKRYSDTMIAGKVGLALCFAFTYHGNFPFSRCNEVQCLRVLLKPEKLSEVSCYVVSCMVLLLLMALINHCSTKQVLAGQIECEKCMREQTDSIRRSGTKGLPHHGVLSCCAHSANIICSALNVLCVQPVHAYRMTRGQLIPCASNEMPGN